VARKLGGGPTDNACHVFAELEAEQPAEAVASFVMKVMLGHGRRRTWPHLTSSDLTYFQLNWLMVLLVPGAWGWKKSKFGEVFKVSFLGFKEDRTHSISLRPSFLSRAWKTCSGIVVENCSHSILSCQEKISCWKFVYPKTSIFVENLSLWKSRAKFEFWAPISPSEICSCLLIYCNFLPALPLRSSPTCFTTRRHWKPGTVR